MFDLSGLGAIFLASAILSVFGVWKLVEIVIWVVTNVSIVVG